jgi:hypothetical protein
VSIVSPNILIVLDALGLLMKAGCSRYRRVSSRCHPHLTTRSTRTHNQPGSPQLTRQVLLCPPPSSSYVRWRSSQQAQTIVWKVQSAKKKGCTDTLANNQINPHSTPKHCILFHTARRSAICTDIKRPTMRPVAMGFPHLTSTIACT